METRTENTADASVISKTGAAMTKEQFEAEKAYRISLTVFKSMLENGIIAKRDFSIIDTKLRAKYRPIFCDLFD